MSIGATPVVTRDWTHLAGSPVRLGQDVAVGWVGLREQRNVDTVDAPRSHLRLSASGWYSMRAGQDVAVG